MLDKARNLILIGASLGGVLVLAALTDPGVLPTSARHIPGELTQGLLWAGWLTASGLLCRLRLPKVPPTLSTGMISLMAGLLAFLWTRRFPSSALLWLSTAPDGYRITALILGALFFGLGFAWKVRFLHLPSLSALASALGTPFLVLLVFHGYLGKLAGLGLGLLAAWALGEWVLRRLPSPEQRPQPSHSVWPAPLSVAVGLALWQVAGLLLGSLSRLSPFSLFAVIFVSLALGYTSLKTGWQRLCTPRSPAGATATDILVSSIILAFLFAGVIAALAPEVGSDALGGRVAMPVRFLRQGSLHPFEDILWSYGMVGGETLFTFFLPLVGTQVAKLLAVTLAGMLYFSLCWRLSNACPLVGGFFLSTLLFVQFCFGHLEMVQLLFWFAAGQASYLAWRGDLSWWVPGLVLGGGAAVKINALGFAVALVPAVVFLYRRDLRRAAQAVSRLSLGGLAVLGPFLLRSLVLTGDPLFPWLKFFFPSFKSRLVDTVPVAHFGIGLSFPKVLSLPWLILKAPEKFVEVGAWHALVMLALLFAALAWWTHDREAKWFSYLGASHWLLWTVTEQNLRYSMAPALLTAFAGSLGLKAWLTEHRQLRRFVRTILLVALIWGFLVQLGMRSFTWLAGSNSSIGLPTKVVFGSEAPSFYLRIRLPSYATAEFLRDMRLQAPRICQLGIRDHLYFSGTQPTDWHSIAPLAKAVFQAHFSDHVPAVLAALRKLGCPLVVLALQNMGELPWEERRGVFSREFMEVRAQVIFAHQGTVVMVKRPDAFEGGEVARRGVGGEQWRAGRGGRMAGREQWILPTPSDRAFIIAAISAGELLQLNLTAKTMGSGHVDFVFRNAQQELTGFMRYHFRFSRPDQTWTCWQTAPPDSRTVAIILSGGPVSLVPPVLFMERISFPGLQKRLATQPGW